MSGTHGRRVSWVAVPSGEAVPPAPPLPPQQPRYSQQARFALGRVLGFGGRTHHHSAEHAIDDDGPTFLQPLSSGNATAIHRTGLEINALSMNEAGTHALIAGRQIFKTLRVDGDSCTEDANIRAAIRTYHASVGDHRAANLTPKETVDVHDVAWARGTTGSYIAAATYNGPIILYDLNRLGIEMARLFEHRRQVHRVTFNPHAGHYMLSASQDGIVRMWDIRDCQRSVATLTSQRATPSQTDGIRDVKWSPTNGTEFALGTDGGWIQKWDIQMMRTAKVKIAGHANACSTIDWHPDGKHLLSAGTDKAVRVWNVYSEGRRQKPLHEIRVPHPLRNARWRPSYQSFVHGDAGVRQCTQVVTSYDKEYPALHLWDLRRPYLPFRELEVYQTSPTDILWHSQDLLWTVGREGVFTQSDVSYAVKTIDKRNAQAFALSPLGELNIVTQTRRPKPMIPKVSSNDDGGKSTNLVSALRKTRSTMDDTLDDNFLSVEMTTNRRRSAPLQDGHRSLSETPPMMAELARGRVLALDSRNERFRPVRPRQMAARGVAPGPNPAILISFFAQKYKLRPYLYPPTVDAMLSIEQIFDQNSGHAKLASLHRLAQSWRIVGRMLSKDLRQRAEENRRRRLKHEVIDPRDHRAREDILVLLRGLVSSGTGRASNPPTPLALPARRLNDLRPASRASSSNISTPRAMPLDPDRPRSAMQMREMPEFGNEAIIQLPPPRLQNVPPEDSSDTHSTNGESRRGNLNVPRPAPLSRGDSDDSFVAFPLSQSLKTSASESTDDTNDKTDGNSADQDGNLRPVKSDSSAAAQAKAAENSHDAANPALNVTAASEKDASSPIIVPAGAKPAVDVSANMETLAMNNQESFSSDTDPKIVSDAEKPAAVETEGKTQMKGPSTVRSETKTAQPKPSKRHTSEFDPRFGAFMSSLDEDPDQESAESFIVEDFLRQDAPLPQPDNPLFSLTGMISELIRYHTNNLSDAQSLSALLLLLLPLLPESSPLNRPTAQAVLSYYVEHLSALQMSDASISGILSKTTTSLILAGLNPLQVESILQTYHDQLVSLSLPVNAALLRRLSFPHFPTVYDTALKENTLQFRCSVCDKPLPASASHTKCTACSARRVQCPICLVPESPFAAIRQKRSTSSNPAPLHTPHPLLVNPQVEAPPTLFTACLRCNHSVHAACAAEWWYAPGLSVSTAACPVAGCGCACVVAPPAVKRESTSSRRGAPRLRAQGSAGSAVSAARS